MRPVMIVASGGGEKYSRRREKIINLSIVGVSLELRSAGCPFAVICS